MKHRVKRLVREEFRLRPFSQAELVKDGADPDPKKEGEYVGNKWGGKFLRAPGIYDVLLEKGRGKLVRLGGVVDVRFGIKSGANEFFYLSEADVKDWQIEARFLRPVIKSPRECRKVIIEAANLKSQLFVCGEDKKALKGTYALEYIKWGEGQKFNERPTTSNRARWWDLGVREIPALIVPCGMNEMYRGFLNTPKVLADKRLYECYPNEGIKDVAAACGINSTVTTMMMDLGSRTGLGEGLIDLTVYEVADCPVLHPRYFENFQLFDRPNQPFYEEVLQPDRRALDEVMFDALKLTAGERAAVYEAVVTLIEKRLLKAGSLKGEG